MTEMPAVQVLQKDKKQEGLEEMKLIAQTFFLEAISTQFNFEQGSLLQDLLNHHK